MIRNLASTCFAALVIHSSAEFRLRGALEGILAAEESPTPNIGEQEKNVINMLRDAADHNDFRILTDFKEFGVMNTAEIMFTFMIWIILYGLLAAYYHAKVRFWVPEDKELEEQEEADDYEEFKDFRSSLFGCCNSRYLGVTFWSCICPGIRWADTMSKVSIHRFWPGFWLLTALYAIGFIPGVLCPICSVFCFAIVVVYCTYHRQLFREKFEFHTVGGASWVSDCCAYTFCMCCSVAQEARHCREAISAKHHATLDCETPRGED